MELSTQLHITTEKTLDLSEIKDNCPDCVKFRGTKPDIGFWTSTYLPNAEFASRWVEWSFSDTEIDPSVFNSYRGFLLTISKSARVYHIDSEEQAGMFFRVYGKLDNMHRWNVKWRYFMKHYDALHVTDDIIKNYQTYGHQFSIWDVESTVFLRPVFDKIELLNRPLVDHELYFSEE